jgi:hypothetical protein
MVLTIELVYLTIFTLLPVGMVHQQLLLTATVFLGIFIYFSMSIMVWILDCDVKKRDAIYLGSIAELAGLMAVLNESFRVFSVIIIVTLFVFFLLFYIKR